MSVLPPMLLQIDVTSISSYAQWNQDDGTGDPWIGYDYQWEVTFNVTPQVHSSHLTPTPFEYNGTDINVGDWIATGPGGISVRIISIVTQSVGAVTCIVEDVDRFNIFCDQLQSGQGIGPIGNGYAFSIANDGAPILMQSADFRLPVGFQSDLESRFKYRNLQQEHIRVNQPSHGFEVGDAIYLDSDGLYKEVDSTNLNYLCGTVADIGAPGVDWFSYKPIGELRTNLDITLPGDPGDLIYVDLNNPGKLTNIAPAIGALPVFIRLGVHVGIMIQRTAPTGKTESYSVEVSSNGQTVFALPEPAIEVLTFSINGVETQGFSFTYPTTVTFDDIATGYSLDVGDEVIIIYTK